MRRGFRWLALAGSFASAPLWAHAPSASHTSVRAAHARPANTAAVARERAEVKRLRQNVAAQESGSQSAAQRLQRQDAEIAELQRQLQAARQAGAAAGKGR